MLNDQATAANPAPTRPLYADTLPVQTRRSLPGVEFVEFARSTMHVGRDARRRRPAGRRRFLAMLAREAAGPSANVAPARPPPHPPPERALAATSARRACRDRSALGL